MKIDMFTFKKCMIGQQEVILSLFEIDKRRPERLLRKNEKESSNVQIVNLKNNLKDLKEELIAKQHREK